MKEENLKSKIGFYFIFLCLIYSHISSAQTDKGVNLVLIIDNELITDRLRFSFESETNENIKFVYSLGKELLLPTALLNSKLSLKFEYIGKLNNEFKDYNYKIDFSPGWLDNSQFLILRIYNLDKKEFRKAFCGEKGDYVIEVQNSVYTMQVPICKELKRF